MRPSKLELLSLAYRQQPQHKVVPKAKHAWAMPSKIKGIGNNLRGAQIVSPEKNETTNIRGVLYQRLSSGQIVRLTEK